MEDGSKKMQGGSSEADPTFLSKMFFSLCAKRSALRDQRRRLEFL
jgi:hypothetical protein